MARISYIGDSGEPLELVVGADNPEVMIGRHRSCAIRTSTQSVSRHHARVYFDGQSYWLQDNGSSNGTYYQNQRLTPQEPVSIDDGEFFMCGNFEMRFDLDEEDLAMLVGEGEDAFDDTMDDVLVEYEEDEAPDATAFVDVGEDAGAYDEPEDYEAVGDDDWEYDDPPPPPTAGAPIPPPPGASAPIPEPPPPPDAEPPLPPAADAQVIEELRGALDARTREVETQEQKIQGLEIELESLSNRLEEIGGAERLGELVEEVEALRPLQAEVEQLRTDLAAAQAGATDSAQIDDLKAELASQNSEIEARNAEVEARDADIAALRAELEQAQEEGGGGASDERVEQLEREIDELSEELEHAKEKYEEARAGRRNAEELASLLRSQVDMTKQAAENSKAEIERLTNELASAGGGDDKALAAAKKAQAAAEKAQAAAEKSLAAAEEKIQQLQAELDAGAAGGGGDVDLREVAELKHQVKEKDDEIARLWTEVEQARAGGGDAAAVEQLKEEVAAARNEADALREQLAAAQSAGDDSDLQARLEASENERDELEAAAAANMKRMKKLMKELDEARAGAGGGGGGDDAALREEIEMLKRELAAAESARDEALAAGDDGGGGGGGDAKLNALVGELNGAVSSFRSDFMQVVDAFELIRSDDEGDRAEGMEQMQEGLDACQGRAGELKGMVRSLRSAID